MKNFREKTTSLLLCITAFLLSCSTQHKDMQVSTLHIKLTNKAYDELIFSMQMEREEGRVNINGKSDNGSDWFFTIPDSLLNTMEWADLFSHYSDSLRSNLAMRYIIERDTVMFSSMSGIQRNGTLNLTYLESNFWKKEIPYRIRDARSDVFLVEEADFEYYADALIRKQHKAGRKACVALMIKLANEHPESAALANYIYSWRDNYRLTKSELDTLYNCFNEPVQNSYWGRKFHDLVTDDVPDNPTLKNLANGEFEHLIIDTAKYNLVIFSASWCGYCHEQIPLLKEVYADLHDKGLEITYITVDKERALEKWNNVMEEYEVPWRSLWTANATDQITFKFSVYGYPHAILFHPGGTHEKIDVRKEPDKEKLYRLFESNTPQN